MQKIFSYILIALISLQFLFPLNIVENIFAVTDTFDLDTASDYSLSDSDNVYIHGSSAKLKGSLIHRGHVENGPAAMDWGTNIIIDGNYAYVAGYGAHAVTSVDISDPTNLSSAGYIGANNTRRLWGAYDLVKVGNYIYVASYIDDDIEVIDATNPTNLQHEGRFIDTETSRLNGARGIDVVGDFAYIAAYNDDALQILDVSDPANPTEKGHLRDTVRLNGAMDIKVVGDYAYVTTYLNDSLQIIDISDPDAPVFAGEVVEGGATELNGAWGIDVVGNFAYVAAYFDDGLEIIDISDPTNPVHTGSLDNSAAGVFLNGARQIEVVGDYAYISAYVDDALQIVDISDPTNPVHEGRLDTTNGRLDAAFGIAVSGDDVFIPSYTLGNLESIDASTTTAPVFQGQLLGGPVRLGTAAGMLIDGDYAYITSYGSSGLEILDISDSANPSHVASMVDQQGTTELWGSWDVSKSGDYIYVSGYSDDGIQVIDVSTPSIPTAIARVLRDDGVIELDNPRGSYIDGDYLYVVSYNSDSLQIIDISNPLVPTARGFVKDNILLNGATDVVVSGNYAYVSSYLADSVSVIDISDPDTPTYQTQILDTVGLELNGAWDLRVDGDYLYVSTYVDDALVTIDISNPLSPSYLDDIDDDGTMRLNAPRGIVYDEGYAYLTTFGDDSLVIIDVSEPDNLLYIDEIRNTNLYERSHGLDKKENDLFFTQYVGSSFSVVRESYSSDSPFVIPENAIDSSFINSMSIMYGAHNEGNVTFQLSKDNGASWYYYNGLTWALTVAGAAQSNDTTTINTNIAGFNTLPGGTDEIKWKAFLNSDGTQKVELDQVLIDYFDITPPIIESSFPREDNLLPKHNFDITFDYFDVDGAYGSGAVTENNGGVGIDTTSANLKLFKWDGVSAWGGNIASSYINFSGSTIGTGSAIYPTIDIPFGKYRMDFSINDNNGNSTSTGVIFYIDEPLFTISGSGIIDMETLSHTFESFSDTVTLTAETIGAGFDIYMNTTTLPSYAPELIPHWDGVTGYGYEQSPFLGNINTMGTNQNIATESGSINTNGERNIFSYDIKLGALIEQSQVGGDYLGNIDFGIQLDY